jgi:hypothetical protein
MQSPMIVFDHVKKAVTAIPTGPRADRKLADVVSTQRKQVSSSGQMKK